MSSISGLSSIFNPYQTSGTSNVGGLNQDLKSLESSLQSGNLSAAQSAFTSLTQVLQSISQTSPSATGSTSSTGSTTSSSPASAIQQDLQAVSSALQSGDISSAKTAFAKLKLDIQTAVKGSSTAVKGHHGGHHHHGGGKSPLASATDTTDASSTTGSSSSSSGNSLEDALLSSIQTGTTNLVNQLA